MRDSERLAFAYFVYLVVMCWLRPLPMDRRVQVTAGGVAMCIAIALAAHAGWPGVRDWAPLSYVLVGYYLPGRTFVRPSTRLETWLATWDRRVLGNPATRFAHWPRGVMAGLDIVYVFGFALVPAGFAALWWTGHAALADRYWTIVVGAQLGAFAPLVVFPTRPPWALEPAPVRPHASVHRAASYFVRYGTIGANTFPSGHTAGSLAIALALFGTLRGSPSCSSHLRSALRPRAWSADTITASTWWPEQHWPWPSGRLWRRLVRKGAVMAHGARHGRGHHAKIKVPAWSRSNVLILCV